MSSWDVGSLWFADTTLWQSKANKKGFIFLNARYRKTSNFSIMPEKVNKGVHRTLVPLDLPIFGYKEPKRMLNAFALFNADRQQSMLTISFAMMN